MSYQTEKFDDWFDFKDRLKKYIGFELSSKRRFVYRGHASHDWKLEPTLVRDFPGRTVGAWPDIEDKLDELVNEFKNSSYGLRAPVEHPNGPSEWEFLGRHHGLPTAILDWSDSPYVAAYFALAEQNQADYACVWVLNHDAVDWTKLSGVSIEDYGDGLRFNVRSVEQRGLSMRCLKPDDPLEILLDKYLIRLDIKRTCREYAISDLDEMLVNHRTLFRDLDGAARLATIRCGLG
ncbi:MAG: FRG domain-containing protein [Planctomycetota bacterium]